MEHQRRRAAKWKTIRKADGHMIGLATDGRGFVFQEVRANEFQLLPLPDPPAAPLGDAPATERRGSSVETKPARAKRLRRRRR